ncbi:MAG: hypothetical protein ABSG41_23010 [Bryobacteraceae bacterium]|jgi:hypothetical protein
MNYWLPRDALPTLTNELQKRTAVALKTLFEAKHLYQKQAVDSPKEIIAGIIEKLNQHGQDRPYFQHQLRVAGIDPVLFRSPTNGTPARIEAQNPVRKRRKFSAASRRKMALAQQARWARVKGEIAPPPATVKTPKPKRRISPEGLKRIIAATKKRWRLQRAAKKAALARKAAPKKVAGKAAVKKAPPTKAVKKFAPARKSAVKTAAPAPTTVPDQMQVGG